MIFDDYKLDSLEQERLRQERSTIGWIYIGIDVARQNISKIGLTTDRLGTRASGSQNPYFALFCAFKIREGVSESKVHEIEDSVIKFLSQYYQRINHYSSCRYSEWFVVNAQEMRDCVHNFLYDQYSSEMYSYWCNDRDIGVIHSWENTQLLQAKLRPEYKASDLSSPPVDSNCYMPGGCGRDCNCWG